MAWDYEDALKKAKELKPSIDYCVEYKNAFMFAAEAERYDFGGDGPVFIMKDSGRALGATAYYDSYISDVVREKFDI